MRTHEVPVAGLEHERFLRDALLAYAMRIVEAKRTVEAKSTVEKEAV